jgi:hypothetical protein
MLVAARQPGIVHDGSRRAVLSRAVMRWDAGNVTSRRFGTSAQHSEKSQRKYGAHHKWYGGRFSGIRQCRVSSEFHRIRHYFYCETSPLTTAWRKDFNLEI